MKLHSFHPMRADAHAGLLATLAFAAVTLPLSWMGAWVHWSQVTGARTLASALLLAGACRLVRGRHWPALLLGLAALAGALVAQPAALVAASAAALAGALCAGESEQRGRLPQAVGLALGAAVMLKLTQLQWPEPFASLDRAFQSSLLGRPANPDADIRLGLLHAGLWSSLTACGALALLHGRRWLRTLLAACALAAIAFGARWASFAFADLPGELELAVTRTALWTGVGNALLVGLAVAVHPLGSEVLPRFAAPQVEPRQRSLWQPAALVVGLLAGVTLGQRLWPAATPAPEHTPQVVFYNAGGVDWLVPTLGRFGAFSSGMFGLLPYALERTGCEVSWVSPGEDLEAALESADSLFVINCGEPFEIEDEERVAAFVERGGNLVALGDHTDVFDLMDGMNPLLERYGIAFRFDSAYPLFESGFSGKVESRTGQFRWLRESDFAPMVAIGASLELSKDAKALSWSDWSFSDIGDRNNVPGSFLGNYSLDLKEQTGPLTLVAFAEYGHGRVVVFGDTTPFQNASLSTTVHNDVTPLMNWLHAGGPPLAPGAETNKTPLPRHGSGAGLPLALALGGALLALAWTPARPALLVGLLALGGLNGLRLRSEAVGALEARSFTRADAICATGHGQWMGDYETQGNHIGPLLTHLKRSGYWITYLEDYSRAGSWMSAGVITLCAPQAPLGARTTENLTRYAESGGLLVVASGPQFAGNLAELLDPLDVEIGSALLSKTHAESPVRFVEPYAMRIAHQTPHEVLARLDGEVTVAYFPMGEGGLLLTSDSRFFSSKNMEGTWTHHDGTIAFVEDLIARFAPGKVEPRTPRAAQP